MAFSLTKFRTDKIPFSGPSKKRGLQRIVLEFTGAVTDVDMDIGDLDGTFWGDIDATAMGVKALEVVTQIQAQIANYVSTSSPQLADRLQAAAASGTSYTVALEGGLPNLTFAASNGEESWVVAIVVELNDGIEPISCHYSA